MTQTSGLGLLTRSRHEAIAIAEANFADIHTRMRQDQVNTLVAMLSQYSPYYCDNCHKTGTVIQLVVHPSSDSELVTNDCMCAKFHRINEQLEVATATAGMPSKYHKAAIEDWQSPARTQDEIKVNERTLSIIENYSSKIGDMLGKGYGLFLCGPNGVGKTYLACAVGIRAIRGGHRVKYYTMSKIVRTVVNGWYDDTSKVVVNDIEEADFLIIDDVDKAYQSKTKLEISVLDNLFRERLQNNRPILVTSNRTLTQIKESHGPSVHSMFSEHCALCLVLGEDYRKKMADDMITDILGP